jgi:hypothetical protein
MKTLTREAVHTIRLVKQWAKTQGLHKASGLQSCTPRFRSKSRFGREPRNVFVCRSPRVNLPRPLLDASIDMDLRFPT